MNEVLTLKPRTRVTWSAEEKAEWLRLFEQSDQTAVDFCRDNDLAPATLSYWRQQVADAEGCEASLVEISREALSSPPPTTSSAAAVTVQLPSGLRFEVPVGLDTAWFGQLLQSLVTAKV
jgi:transposase-like protein